MSDNNKTLAGHPPATRGPGGQRIGEAHHRPNRGSTDGNDEVGGEGEPLTAPPKKHEDHHKQHDVKQPTHEPPHVTPKNNVHQPRGGNH